MCIHCFFLFVIFALDEGRVGGGGRVIVGTQKRGHTFDHVSYVVPAHVRCTYNAATPELSATAALKGRNGGVLV